MRQIASCTLAMGPQVRRENKTFVSRTALGRDVCITFGISASKLAEPLRVFVPEVFDEIEQERLRKSVADLKPEESPEHLNVEDEEKEEDGLENEPPDDVVVQEDQPIDQQILDKAESPKSGQVDSLSLPATSSDWQDFSIDDNN